jgi:hypothetical protein
MASIWAFRYAIFNAKLAGDARAFNFNSPQSKDEAQM